MNEIKLPPLPFAVRASQADYSSGDMEAYARAAIELDRQGRGEPDYLISACYFPKAGEVELSWERKGDGAKAHVTFKVTAEQGKQIANVVWPCVYYTANPQPADPVVKDSLTAAEPVKVPSETELMCKVDDLLGLFPHQLATQKFSVSENGFLKTESGETGFYEKTSADNLFIELRDGLREIQALLASYGQPAQPADSTEAVKDAIELLAKYRRLCKEVRRGDGYHLQRINNAIVALNTAPVAAQPSVPDGYALVPIRPNGEMERLMQEEDWQWPDLLAAADAITEQQYGSLSAGQPDPAMAGDDRTAFEAAYIDHGGLRLEDYDFKYDPATNQYLDDFEQSAWWAWQEARKRVKPASGEDASYGWNARHIKTRNIYRVIGEATNATNAQDGQGMAIYRRDGKTYVREAAEFQDKFEAMQREKP